MVTLRVLGDTGDTGDTVKEDVGGVWFELEVTAGTFMQYAVSIMIETVAGSATGVWFKFF